MAVVKPVKRKGGGTELKATVAQYKARYSVAYGCIHRERAIELIGTNETVQSM
jgi:hypothetical protein